MAEIHYLQGTVLDEELLCSLTELCRLCGVTAEVVHEMVAEGIITPSSSPGQQWRFTALEIRRVQTTIRLQQDLQVNLPGCALALDLLEELEELRLRRGRQR
ncbi:chaperone modulator CbpM [Desulfogranum mediterraneum]|uniref:chaperone modulator CbpM n=1 Tax=Desulfogranum mediterraneum TaxID=160661 RepID=UPI00042362C2|nr:chaperone modulator CbpM [Desulfogranum mediterraneum]